MAAVGAKAKLGTRFAKGLKYVHVAGGTDVLTVRNALEHYPSRNVRKAGWFQLIDATHFANLSAGV